MSGELVFVVHPDGEVRDHLGEALHGASYMVLAFRAGSEAEERVDTYGFFLPEGIPVVVLGSGENGERRRALLLEAMRLRDEEARDAANGAWSDCSTRRRDARTPISPLTPTARYFRDFPWNGDDSG